VGICGDLRGDEWGDTWYRVGSFRKFYDDYMRETQKYNMKILCCYHVVIYQFWGSLESWGSVGI